MRKGWTDTTLDEVAIVVNGSTPSTKESEYWGGDIPWITTTELTACDGGFVSSSIRKITSAAIKSGGARVVRSGTTLLGTTATIGTAALTLVDTSFNQQISGLLPKSEKVLDEFIFLWARGNRIQLDDLSAGTSFKRISTANLRNLRFVLPPLAEQKRIVDVVSSVDAYIDALQQQVDRARAARNAVLHQLLSAGGDDWTESTLGEIITLEYGKPLKAENRDGKGFPVFGSAGEVGLHSKPLVNEAPVIVVGRKGTAGAVWWSDLPCSVIDTAFYVVQKVETDIRFLYFILGYLDLPSLTAQTGVPGLNRDRAYSSQVLLPPLEEQKRIVEIVSCMDDVIQGTEQAVTDAKNLRSGLLSDLLSGEHEIPMSYDKFLKAA